MAIPLAVVVGLAAQQRSENKKRPTVKPLSARRRIRERCLAQWEDVARSEEAADTTELLLPAAAPGIAWDRALVGALVAGEHAEDRATRIDDVTATAIATPIIASTLWVNEPWHQESPAESPRSTFWRAALATFALFMIAILGVAWFGSSSEPAASSRAAATTTVTPQAWNSHAIIDYRPGMWAMARNPELLDKEDASLEYFDQETDCLIRFELRKPDGGLLEFSLVRDHFWLEQNQARIGSLVDTELEELGVHAPATVVAIETAPVTSPRRHPHQRLVTGTFKHHVPVTVRLQILDIESKKTTELECTPNHPIWCPERRGFVRVDELRLGQALASALPGEFRLVSITPRAGPTTVYNLEVNGQHVYYASGYATLVHNGCATNTHHSDPKFMGGKKDQRVTVMPIEKLKELHKDLNDHLRQKTNADGKHMRPQRNNLGDDIRRNFSQNKRNAAMAEFYKNNQHKYPEAAHDYFHQHPDLL